MERLRAMPKRVREEVRITVLGARLLKECILAAMFEEGERGDIVHKANMVELVRRELGGDRSEVLKLPVVRSLGGETLLNELRARWGEGESL